MHRRAQVRAQVVERRAQRAPREHARVLCADPRAHRRVLLRERRPLPAVRVAHVVLHRARGEEAAQDPGRGLGEDRAKDDVQRKEEHDARLHEAHAPVEALRAPQRRRRHLRHARHRVRFAGGARRLAQQVLHERHWVLARGALAAHRRKHLGKGVLVRRGARGGARARVGHGARRGVCGGRGRRVVPLRHAHGLRVEPDVSLAAPGVGDARQAVAAALEDALAPRLPFVLRTHGGGWITCGARSQVFICTVAGVGGAYVFVLPGCAPCPQCEASRGKSVWRVRPARRRRRPRRTRS